MRVLLVNDYPTTRGGANIMTLRLRDELRRRGHDARLLASRARGGARLADYHCFGTMSRPRVFVEAANPWAFFALRRALREFRPDVVHVRMFLTQLSPLILPLLRDVPSLYHAAIYESVCPMGTKLLPDRSVCGARAGRVCLRAGCTPLRAWLPQMARMRLWRRWRSAFDVVVTNSHAVRRQLCADGVEATETIWNGVPDGGARPPLSGPPTVAFAGSLIPLKGVDVLLRAFRSVAGRLPGARLLVAGDGRERERLRRLASELGVAEGVKMTGHLPAGELERALGGAWAQAVPSFAEQFGLSAVEAAMRGTATVASCVGGLPEVVRDGRTGFLFAAGDHEALAARLVELLRDRERAERMGREARADALARFSMSACAERFERLYERLRDAHAGRN